MHIGWQPNSADFSHPADRRKLTFFLDQSGLEFEIAQYDKHYDVVYLSLGVDLGRWVNYKSDQCIKNNETRVVFDLSDSYLTSGFLSDIIRPIYHFLVGRTSSLGLSYKKSLLKMLASVDVVVCGSHEQKSRLDNYHDNVIVVRDYFGKDINAKKTNYSLIKNGELHLLWEGFSHGNSKIFSMLCKVLEQIEGVNVHLHVITDSEYCAVGGKHFCKPTYSVLNEIFSKSSVQFHLYDWNSVTFASIVTSCDMALIPIPNDPVMHHKPENKLLLLWSLGIPVITSATPSYTRVFKCIDEDMVCSNESDWVHKINELMIGSTRREEYMSAASIYLNENCSDKIIMDTWNRIILNV